MDWKLCLLVYITYKLGTSGISWLILSSTHKNITKHIETLKLKPSSGKRPGITKLNVRRKLTKIIPPLVLFPGFGDLLFIVTILGRFSNKTKIEDIYSRAINKTDINNLNDALNKLGESNRAVYKDIKKNTGFLTVNGHAEIARQSILTLNNLIVEANIAGIDLKNDQSIKDALRDTASLVAELLKGEQSGVQSNIDTYLNVIGNIKKDMTDKKSVFMDSPLSVKSNPKYN